MKKNRHWLIQSLLSQLKIKSMENLKVIISGGGTGGHIFPALAIANEIKHRHPGANILFVGANGRMEMEKVPQVGYEIIGLDISGYKRDKIFANFKVVYQFITSFFKAKRIIKSFKPDIVIGTGGYASSAILMAATRMNIKTIIQEQNNYAGLTNRKLGKRVNKICVAYDGMEKFFPLSKLVFTGNPVREELLQLPTRDQAMVFFGLDPSKTTVLVVGGSLGARTINQAIESYLPLFESNHLQLIWQTGKNYKVTTTPLPAGVLVKEFIREMPFAYAAADLVVSRAGAIAVSEICVTHKASILIPSPNVAEDHQTSNAISLTVKMAALFVPDSKAKENLWMSINQLASNPEQRNKLSQECALLAVPDAAKRIVNEVEKLLESE